jgi:hypothetical protein
MANVLLGAIGRGLVVNDEDDCGDAQGGRTAVARECLYPRIQVESERRARAPCRAVAGGGTQRSPMV